MNKQIIFIGILLTAHCTHGMNQTDISPLQSALECSIFSHDNKSKTCKDQYIITCSQLPLTLGKEIQNAINSVNSSDSFNKNNKKIAFNEIDSIVTDDYIYNFIDTVVINNNDNKYNITIYDIFRDDILKDDISFIEENIKKNQSDDHAPFILNINSKIDHNDLTKKLSQKGFVNTGTFMNTKNEQSSNKQSLSSRLFSFSKKLFLLFGGGLLCYCIIKKVISYRQLI